MAFADKLLNRFAVAEVDRIFFGELDHPCNGIAIGSAVVGQPGQSYGEDFLDRFELPSGKLFAN
jgi:hypothetical protein